MPFISIIIPVYNTENFLPKCLNTAVNQTFQDIEIIIVNDASPDNSEIIIQQYKQKDSRIKYIKHDKNKGLFSARETGVRNASSEYILHLDSDDWLDIRACEHIAQKRQQNPSIDLLMHSAYHMFKKTKFKNHAHSEKVENLFKLYTQEKFAYHRFMWQFSFRRDSSIKIYDDLQVLDHLILSEDLLFFTCYLYYTQNWHYISEVCYYYNEINLNSATRKNVTTETALKDLANMKIVFDSFEKFRTLHNLPIDTFNNLKQKQQLDRMWEMKEMYETLDWTVLLPVYTEIFDANTFVQTIFDIEHTLSLRNIQKRILIPIIRLQENFIPENGVLFEFLKKLWWRKIK